MKTIFFDMDGTLNRLYDYPNWLEKLRAFDPSPYAEAEVNLNMSLLARYLNKLRTMGFRVEIISWLSQVPNPAYDQAVTAEKYSWLDKHLGSVEFDAIHITAYGVPKQNFITEEDDILFDDNAAIRQAWTGRAYEPSEILTVLYDLIKGN